ncbi:hypothetical protein HYC85_004059 [Camellia sinensis]|uniref:S1 motif domain-containing protein n=1 Tax=Camellia sinensis TaxID=4442 RepID=A0A7J7HXK4_CAMSI|nr:hypothetical protein HYC85_004059 [Camellia sinensis]
MLLTILYLLSLFSLQARYCMYGSFEVGATRRTAQGMPCEASLHTTGHGQRPPAVLASCKLGDVIKAELYSIEANALYVHELITCSDLFSMEEVATYSNKEVVARETEVEETYNSTEVEEMVKGEEGICSSMEVVVMEMEEVVTYSNKDVAAREMEVEETYYSMEVEEMVKGEDGICSSMEVVVMEMEEVVICSSKEEVEVGATAVVVTYNSKVMVAVGTCINKAAVVEEKHKCKACNQLLHV